tara:strand:- start:276 stop:713 length:438 start_codon:yes stop_codon:yes gene_type:complete
MDSIYLGKSLEKINSHVIRPLMNESISAGFPSPADDYIDIGIDLNEHLIKNPISTFFLRVSGNSMTNAGIYDKDLIIVDRSINPKIGDIIIAVLDDLFILKRLSQINNKLYLEPANNDYPNIDISKYEKFQVWGVAIYCVHNLTR